MLQHLSMEDKHAALQEIRRVLKVKGKVCVLEALSFQQAQEKDSGIFLTAGDWRKMFLDHGFEILNEKPLHAYPLMRGYAGIKYSLGSLIKFLKRQTASSQKGLRTVPSLREPRSGAKQSGELETNSEIASDTAYPRNDKKIRHVFYDALDQFLLTILGCISFPLEFVWLRWGGKASHRYFLAMKPETPCPS